MFFLFVSTPRLFISARVFGIGRGGELGAFEMPDRAKRDINDLMFEAFWEKGGDGAAKSEDTRWSKTTK